MASIIYATQTGTSQEIAEQIFLELYKRNISSSLSNIDAYNLQNLIDSTLKIFVVSTSGQGNMPKSFTKNWNFLLKKNLRADILSGVVFCVFGLGDSSYKKFNFAAKKLCSRLKQLGATEVISRGDGDDQHSAGVDGAFFPWLQELFSYFGSPSISLDPPPKVSIEISNETSTDSIRSIKPATLRFNEKLIEFDCVENVRVTPESHFQDIRNLKFEFKESIQYRAGDIFVIRPQNTQKVVNDFLDFCKWQEIAFKPLHLTKQRADCNPLLNLSFNWTLHELCIHYFDLLHIPRRHFFRLLSKNSTRHQEKLLELAQDQDEWNRYVWKPKRTAFEILIEFEIVPELGLMFDLFPSLQPRSFSISKLNERSLELTVGIVEYNTLLKNRTGVCTQWMKTLNGRVQASVESGIFRDLKGTLILICNGTGIAPMRNIISRYSSKIYLFYGYRYTGKDNLYFSEFTHITVYSRGSRDSSQKVYVQDLVMEHKELIRKLVFDGAMILVSGNSKLPDELDRVLSEIFADQGDDFVARLENDGRYQSETW